MKKFVILNVVFQPHPEGIYEEVFRSAGEIGRGFQYFGERYATISPISKVRRNVFTGRLATWIEPDRTAKTIDISSFEQRVFDESGVVIPRGTGLNSKVFNFAFNLREHSLVLELENDERQSISPAQGLRALQNVLRGSDRKKQVEDISVYVKSKVDAVETLLSLPAIRKVKIDLHRPNPDDFSDDEEDILRELEEENAKRKVTEIVRAPQRETIQLNARHRAMASVAKDNGFVEVSGTDINGDRVKLSTKEMPEIIYRGTEDDSGAVVARNIAEELSGDDVVE